VSGPPAPLPQSATRLALVLIPALPFFLFFRVVPALTCLLWRSPLFQKDRESPHHSQMIAPPPPFGGLRLYAPSSEHCRTSLTVLIFPRSLLGRLTLSGGHVFSVKSRGFGVCVPGTPGNLVPWVAPPQPLVSPADLLYLPVSRGPLDLSNRFLTAGYFHRILFFGVSGASWLVFSIGNSVCFLPVPESEVPQ